MTDLIARLEAAPVGSRELDGRIWCMINGRIFVESFGDGQCGYREAPRQRVQASPELPHYTISLDAKIPDENIVRVQFFPDTEKYAAWNHGNGRTVHGEGHTEPLARRAAAMKARQVDD